MTWVAIELLFTVLEAAIKVYFFTAYFGIKRRIKKRAILIISAIVVESAIVQTFNHITIFEGLWGAAIYFTVSFTFCLIFLEGNWVEKGIACFCCESIIAIIAYTVIYLIVLGSNLEFTELVQQQEIWRLILFIVTKALFLFVAIIAVRLRNKNKLYFSKYEWAIVLAIFACSTALMMVIFEMTLHLPAPEQNGQFLIITVVGLLVINIAAIVLTGKIAKSNEQRMKMDLLNLQLEQQTKSIMEINKKYQSIVEIRHDVKKTLNCTTALLEDDKREEAIQYLKNMTQSPLLKVDQYIATPNSVINAVLNYELSLCAEKGIKTKCNITSSMQEFSEIDMSRLLANLLDNAIEASMMVHNPQVSVEIYDKKNYRFIVVGNKIARSVLAENPELETTKKDKTKHGLGMRIIKELVQRYEGSIEFFEEYGMFYCSVMIEIPV